MKVKGRIWLAWWVVFTLAMLGWVVARNTAGYVSAGELEQLRTQRSVLQARRVALLRRISQAESPAILQRRAATLGLRQAADSEIVNLRAATRKER